MKKPPFIIIMKYKIVRSVRGFFLTPPQYNQQFNPRQHKKLTPQSTNCAQPSVKRTSIAASFVRKQIFLRILFYCQVVSQKLCSPTFGWFCWMRFLLAKTAWPIFLFGNDHAPGAINDTGCFHSHNSSILVSTLHHGVVREKLFTMRAGNYCKVLMLSHVVHWTQTIGLSTESITDPPA